MAKQQIDRNSTDPRADAVAAPDTRRLDEWFRSTDSPRIGYVSGNRFDLKRVRYSALGEMAIFEGDIALGTAAEMDRLTLAMDDVGAMPVSGVVIASDRFRWPGGVIPYEIEPGMPAPERVLAAIAHWEARTPIRFVAWTPDDEEKYPNYVSFVARDGCWSQVGMRGGKQLLSLAPACGPGSAIHEIGHAVGLWHEQSREDRDQYVRVVWENIKSGMEHNFEQHITDGDDVGSYDCDSIMHYPAAAFSRNGQPTLVPLGGQAIGQRNGLSPADIAAVIAIYGQVQPEVPFVGQKAGVQFEGTVPARSAHRWVTRDWPASWHVVWTVVPEPGEVGAATHLDWDVSVERGDDSLVNYHIEVRNLGRSNARFSARYAIVAGLE